MGQLRKRGDVWWIRYYRGGRRYEESARTDKKEVARDLLRTREGDIAKGVPVSSKIARFRFDDAVKDITNDYAANARKSADGLERRIRLHLEPTFKGRRMSDITTSDVTSFTAARLKAGASAGEINRELAILKRMFTLAVTSGRLFYRPHIPALREDNVRTGFFEPEQFESVRTRLPAALRPVVTFAYVTGWRMASEVLPLEWRQIDFKAGEIRLDAGTTKNGDGRVFPITDDLRIILKAQHADHLKLKKAGTIEPWVFFRMVGKGRRGKKEPRRITSLKKAWSTACAAAGCPGRLLHDLRRTAVRNMVRRGVPERVAMQLTGHKTRSIFDRYNIVSSGDIKTAAAQLRGLAGTIQGQSAASDGTADQ